MDYRHTAIDTLTEFAQEFPDMSLGEILYSSLRKSNLGKDITTASDLIQLEDKEIYEAIEKANKDEREQE